MASVTGSVSDKMMISLLNYVSVIGKTAIELEDGERISPRTANSIFICPQKRFCNGLCNIDDMDCNITLGSTVSIEKKDDFWGNGDNKLHPMNITSINANLPDIVSNEDLKTISIDRDALIAAYKTESKPVAALCERFKPDEVINRIASLPESIVLKKWSPWGNDDDDDDSEGVPENHTENSLSDEKLNNMKHPSIHAEHIGDQPMVIELSDETISKLAAAIANAIKR
jgi:hypothetical protein